MRTLLAPLAVSTFLCLSACGGDLSGVYLGELDCVNEPFELELVLSKESGKTFTGEGKQQRVFDNVSGDRIDILVQFEASFTVDGGGAQLLTSDIDCVSESTVVYEVNDAGQIVGEGEITSEGCAPRRFVDYAVDWDGADTLNLTGPDGCSGTLTRK